MGVVARGSKISNDVSQREGNATENTLSLPLLAFCIEGGSHSCLEAESLCPPICNMSLCV